MDSGEIPGNGSNPKRQRRVYPFSIVAGGVHGREELAVAMSRDSLVERHYSDFDVSKTRVAKLAAPKTGFVSYRLNNKVYWTKNKITLPRGEEVLTDGVNYARTRCGNRISENEPGETSALEPPPEALDTPTEDLIATELPDDLPKYSGPEFDPDVIDALLGSNLSGMDDPGSSLFISEFANGPIGFPGGYSAPIPIGHDRGLSVTPLIAPDSDPEDPGEPSGAAAVNVPETNSFVLMLMGLVTLAIHRYSMTKRKNTKHSKIDACRPQPRPRPLLSMGFDRHD
jgi:hypothetical protein